MKQRLDQLLVALGHYPSRERAQAAIMAGLVKVGGEVATKAGQQVAESATVEIAGQVHPYVSRGGLKLEKALDSFQVDPKDRFVLDAGASTGGFTDVLLQRGAARVVALDVGYGQLHPKLRADPRVTVLERTNARSVAELPFAPQLVVCDVSFISVRIALPPLLALAAPGWQALVLVKPQFEAGREEVPRGGVVRDPEVHRRVVREVAEAALGWGGEPVGAVDSGLPGPKGNREFVLHVVQRPHPRRPADLDAWIDAAVSG
jgi:23S rRNA (cytidine1920-2'-O)/16S rRNA (cytidine1409-2'-O)-methyltransferase